MARIPKWKRGLEIDIEDFPKYSGENVEKLYDIYKAMRRQVNVRKNRFRRSGEFSHALERYDREAKEQLQFVGPKSYNSLVGEIVLMQKFFNSETSSVTGAREVNKREDLRIFGPSARSETKPARTMTARERELYWDLVDEWYDQQFKTNSHLASGQIQRSLADLMFKSDDFNEATLVEKLNQLTAHAKGDIMVDKETGHNVVLRGTRYDSP